MLAERPEVFNHNIETVRRLHRGMRGAKASYDKALWLLRRAKAVADYPRYFEDPGWTAGSVISTSSSWHSWM